MTKSSKFTAQNNMLRELSRAFTEIPFNRMLGLRLDHLEPGQVSMSFKMKNALIGNYLHGILHGGVTSSVLDMAGGMAVMAATIHKYANRTVTELAHLIGKCSTIDLQVSFIRPGKGDFFIAKAWLMKSGSKISFARMELLNDKESLIASGTGTYISR